MPPEGFVEYKRREFCKDIRCQVQMIMDKHGEDSPEYDRLRDICKSACIHSTYEFHHWLIEKKYLILRR